MNRIPLFSLSLVLLLLLAIVGCGSPRVADVVALTGDVDRGSVLYGNNCASCHGATGEDTGTAPGIASDEIAGHSDEQFADAILRGHGLEMPAFEDSLDDQEIADIIAYARLLGE